MIAFYEGLIQSSLFGTEVVSITHLNPKQLAKISALFKFKFYLGEK